MLIISKGKKKVDKRDQGVYKLRSDDYPNQVLHAVKRRLKIIKKVSEYVFLPQRNLKKSRFLQRKVTIILVSEINADDDNDPVLENLPNPVQDNEINYKDWGWKNECHYFIKGVANTN